MSYRAGKLLSSVRGHSPTHSPRASGCKLAPLPRPVWRSANCSAAVERRQIASRTCDEHLPLNQSDLITQIYAAQQDLPLREFTSYFNGRTRNNVPPCLTSHEGSSSRISSVYSSLQQSVKWDPNQPIRSDHKYNCRCMDCQSAHCPGEAAARATANRNCIFKSNIMTFCDQHTMTPKVNDVSCGICLGVGLITENKSIETTLCTSKQDTRTSPNTRRKHCNIPPDPVCLRVPSTMKRSLRYNRPKRERRKMLVYEDCEDFGRRMRRCFQDEAVRDTDPADYCTIPNEQLDENVNCRYPSPPPSTVYEVEQRSSQITNNGQLDSMPIDSGRKTLYNEGISDDIANNLPLRSHRQELPASLDWCCPETDNWIPYSHKGTSRYHVDCKKPPEQRYRAECEPGDLYCVMDYPRRYVKKVFYSKCPNPVVCPSYAMHLPRKMLTSEKDIDAFIVCKGDCKGKRDWSCE